MPLLRPLTTTGLAVPVPVLVAPAPVQLALYAVMADPPLELGALNARLAPPSAGVATKAVGAPGTLALGLGLGLVLPEPPPPQASSSALSKKVAVGL